MSTGRKKRQRNKLRETSNYFCIQFPLKTIEGIILGLRAHETRAEELEMEYLEPYDSVVENLKQRSVSWISNHAGWQ